MVGLKDDLTAALDPAAFARLCGLDNPDPWQTKLLRSSSPRILVNASRQSGKSSVAAIKALHTAVYLPGSLVLILAPAFRQSVESFRKTLDAYHAGAESVEPNSEAKMHLELSNGSRVVALPGTEKTVRGYSDARLVIVDEASRIDDDLYLALRPMLLVSGGSLLMISTPWGKRGVFHSEWTNGGGWERYHIPATMVPRFPPEDLEEERKRGERYFRQEFLCEFVETEDQVFSHDLVMAAVAEDLESFTDLVPFSGGTALVPEDESEVFMDLEPYDHLY